MTLNKCSCGETDLTKFGRNKFRSNGLSHRCLLCWAKYRTNNKDSIKIYFKQYYQATKANTKKSRQTHRRSHNKEYNEYNKKYRTANKGKVNALTRKRQASKLLRTPTWLNKLDYNIIESFYKESINRTCLTGIKYVVDHIVLLQGKTVSGLHVPWNLQILTKQINDSKGNKWPF